MKASLGYTNLSWKEKEQQQQTPTTARGWRDCWVFHSRGLHDVWQRCLPTVWSYLLLSSLVPIPTRTGQTLEVSLKLRQLSVGPPCSEIKTRLLRSLYAVWMLRLFGGGYCSQSTWIWVVEGIYHPAYEEHLNKLSIHNCITFQEHMQILDKLHRNPLCEVHQMASIKPQHSFWPKLNFSVSNFLSFNSISHSSCNFHCSSPRERVFTLALSSAL